MLPAAVVSVFIYCIDIETNVIDSHTYIYVNRQIKRLVDLLVGYC